MTGYVAFCLFLSASSNGGDDDVVDDLTPPQSQDVAADLLAAANPGVLLSLANHMAEGVDIDEANIGDALSTLANMLSSQSGLSALLDFPAGSTNSGGKLLSDTDTQNAMSLISQYFSTLSVVLQQNPQLKSQISNMIQRQADDLAANGSNLESVLQSIMESDAFKQLREEIEEELSEKGGPEPGAAPADDMSR